MELILKAAGKEIPCLDWPTAIVGLRTITGASSVTRKDVPEGAVCQVLLMPSSRRLWVGLQQRRPGENVLYKIEPEIVAPYLDRLMAGEDI